VDKIKSRKLWATVATALLVLCNRKLALGLDAADLATLAGLVATYLVAQGIVDKEQDKGVK
jgi:hypothetical protein